MPVYVDDMKASYARMVMSHMIADSDCELDSMADIIGVARRWKQHAGTSDVHYDICQSKRQIAIDAGAIPITRRQLTCMVRIRRLTGRLGSPETAIQDFKSIVASRFADAADAFKGHGTTP